MIAENTFASDVELTSPDPFVASSVDKWAVHPVRRSDQGQTKPPLKMKQDRAQHLTYEEGNWHNLTA